MGPSTPGEYVTLLAHFYRGEIARMSSWRDRIDRTSNWAMTVVAAMISVTLSNHNSHHSIMVMAMALLVMLVSIESRRYRFFDSFRRRVRKLESHYLAPALWPDEADADQEWRKDLSQDLRTPRFRITFRQALATRLRRNYVWMFLIVDVAWLLKLDGVEPLEGHLGVSTLGELVDSASIGPLSGMVVIAAAVVVQAALLLVMLTPFPADADLDPEGVHV